MKAMHRMNSGQEEEHFWPSFTDVMSSLAFVLFFFIVILFVKQIMSAKTWDNQMAQAASSLAEKQTLIEKTESDLALINEELEQKKQEMAGLEASLSDRETRINQLEGQLSKDRQSLSQKESELTDLRSQLKEISVLRLSLLKDVKQSIEAELDTTFESNSGPLVAIDDNANLVIQSSLLFAKGSSAISENGRKMLRQFSIAFNKILSSPSVRENIDSIIISGYADSDDTFHNNYALSCERAIAVITTMMKENPALEKNYGQFFQASGFSEFRPLVKETDEASKAKNRRIQISINIKDAHIQEIITDYMSKQP